MKIGLRNPRLPAPIHVVDLDEIRHGFGRIVLLHVELTDGVEDLSLEVRLDIFGGEEGIEGVARLIVIAELRVDFRF